MELRRGDPRYPALLAQCPDAPALLRLRGALAPQDERCVAIVGTRALTAYGERVARDIATDLASAGFTIVSGLAHGVDEVAHRAALAAGGRTLAVLGCGLAAFHGSVAAARSSPASPRAAPSCPNTTTTWCAVGLTHPTQAPSDLLVVDRRAIGAEAESAAARALARRGYVVVARNVRLRGGELDLVCRDGAAYVFCEVKARRPSPLGRAEEALTVRKRDRLLRLAATYLARIGRPGAEYRVELVAVRLDEHARPIDAALLPFG